jgi:ABC-type cobalamin/Fe3+-siderophores transport system ATPase subunit
MEPLKQIRLRIVASLITALLGSGPAYGQKLFDTHQRYSQNETYSPQRLELHQRLVTEAIENAPKVSRPALIVILGGPGAGKSTMLKLMNDIGLLEKERFVVANSDLFKEKLPEYEAFKKIAPTQAAALVHRESVEIRSKVLYQAGAASHNVILEMAAIETLPPEQLLQLKKQLFPRHSFALINIEAKLATMIARTETRGAETGRWVAREKVISGRQNSGELFKHLAPLADVALEIDSENSTPIIKSTHQKGLMSKFAVELTGLLNNFERPRGHTGPLEGLMSFASMQTMGRAVGPCSMLQRLMQQQQSQ